MKKITAGILLFSLAALLLVSCGVQEGGGRYDYDLSEYVELRELDPIHAAYSDPTICTEEEIDGAVFQILLTYADFAEKENTTVEQYDKAVVDYSIFMDGKELEEYSQSEYGIIIGYDGSGDVDAALAKELLGKSVGDQCKAQYTFPKNDISLGSWAGVTVEVRGTILSVYRALVPECTDALVQSIGDGFENVSDFREQLKADMLAQKAEQKKTAVLNAFMDAATVKKYPQKELAAYRDKYLQELRAGAEEMGVEYTEYLEKYLNLTEDGASKAAQSDAERRVKSDLACIQASRLMKTTLTDEEYEKGLQGYYESEQDQFESIEEFEDYYTREFMYDCILWDKTFEKLVENAVAK